MFSSIQTINLKHSPLQLGCIFVRLTILRSSIYTRVALEHPKASFIISILGHDIILICAIRLCNSFVRLICAIILCNFHVMSSTVTQLCALSACHSHGTPFPRIHEFLHQCSLVSNWFSRDISHVPLIVA